MDGYYLNTKENFDLLIDVQTSDVCSSFVVFPLLEFTGGLPEPGRHNVYYQWQEAEVFINLVQTVTPFEFHRPVNLR